MYSKYLKFFTLIIVCFSLVYCSKEEASDSSNNNDVTDNGGSTDPIILPFENLDPDKSPGDNFDLSKWNLSIPVAESDGTATDIKTSSLVNNYENSTYFYTGNDGAMVFKNFIKGAKTSLNTSYTRSELREMIYGTKYDTQSGLSTKDLANNWLFSSSDQDKKDEAGGVGGELTATVKIDHVTSTGTLDYQIGRVIIGQIHASDDEPCRLYYRKLPNNTQGSIYFAHEPTNSSEQWHELIGSRSDNQSNSFDGIEIGEIFSYSINVEGNDLTVTIIREGKADVAKTIDMTNSGFANDYMYFKAGVYSQNNTGDDNDYDQVSFYELNVTH